MRDEGASLSAEIPNPNAGLRRPEQLRARTVQRQVQRTHLLGSLLRYAEDVELARRVVRLASRAIADSRKRVAKSGCKLYGRILEGLCATYTHDVGSLSEAARAPGVQAWGPTFLAHVGVAPWSQTPRSLPPSRQLCF